MSFPIMSTNSEAMAEHVAPESKRAYVGQLSLIPDTNTGTMGLIPPRPAYAAASQEVSSLCSSCDSRSWWMVVWCRPLHR